MMEGSLSRTLQKTLPVPTYSPYCIYFWLIPFGVAVGGLSYLSIQVSTEQCGTKIFAQSGPRPLFLNKVSRHSFFKQKRKTSVPDPWLFGTDPRIRNSDYGFRSGSRSGFCSFHHYRNLQNGPKKKFQSLFRITVWFEGIFTSFFKDKKSQISRKWVWYPVEIKVFLTHFAWLWKDPDPYLWLADPDRRDLKTYGSGSGTL